MDSKARCAGRAVHPMLVVFPLAFYTATVAALLAYLGTQEAFWYRLAMIANIAGIVTAVIAVLPGAIALPWLPATSRARAVGLRHAGADALATGLFAATAVLAYRSAQHPVLVEGRYMIDATIPLAMSLVAWVAMVIAAALSWMRVHTHHAGAGAKAAFLHADRATRERELNVTVYDVLADNLGHVDRHPSPAGPAGAAGSAAKEAPPLSMHS